MLSTLLDILKCLEVDGGLVVPHIITLRPHVPSLADSSQVENSVEFRPGLGEGTSYLILILILIMIYYLIDSRS